MSDALRCGSSECVKHDRCVDCPVNVDADKRRKEKDPVQAMLRELVAYCGKRDGAYSKAKGGDYETGREEAYGDIAEWAKERLK